MIMVIRKLYVFFFFSHLVLGAQSVNTHTPSVQETNVPNGRIQIVLITDKATFVRMDYERANKLVSWLRISSNTYLYDRKTGTKHRILSLMDKTLDRKYDISHVKKGDATRFIMVFPPLPNGSTSIDIIEPNGFIWKGMTINNPAINLATGWTEKKLITHWEDGEIDEIEGVYEDFEKDDFGIKYKLALLKEKGGYKLIYLDGAKNRQWSEGELKAKLIETATPNFYNTEWHKLNKRVNKDMHIQIEQGLLKRYINPSEETLMIKLYPTANDASHKFKNIVSSGTGFAISSNGYLVTNQHVIDGMSVISVTGVNGDFSHKYRSELVHEDKVNDLAILKIIDSDFSSFGTIPYPIVSNQFDVGTSVFTLGYPLRASMGEEIKLTNGIISSRSGFEGDVTQYQVTVPVQSGNSGSPLFAENGSVIGIITSKHSGADNVSYAVKTSLLINLIQSITSKKSIHISSDNNEIISKTLSEQVKAIRGFVYIVECER